jgi:hypothetical protein
MSTSLWRRSTPYSNYLLIICRGHLVCWWTDFCLLKKSS